MCDEQHYWGVLKRQGGEAYRGAAKFNWYDGVGTSAIRPRGASTIGTARASEVQQRRTPEQSEDVVGKPL